jgi:hypothetical protein
MSDLYAALPKFSKAHRLVHLPPQTKVTIQLWRTFLIKSQILRDRGFPTGRCIDSFRILHPSILIEFDGSPSGIGFRIFSLISPNHHSLVEEHGAMITFDLHNDSQYQNTMEISAATCGIVRALSIFGPNINVKCRGDSEVALSWLNNNQSSFKSSRAKGPAMILISLRTLFNISISQTNVHIPKDDNTRADALSRNLHLNRINEIPIFRSTSPSSSTHSILNLCNPLDQPNDELSIIQRWHTIDSTLNKCVYNYNTS